MKGPAVPASPPSVHGLRTAACRKIQARAYVSARELRTVSTDPVAAHAVAAEPATTATTEGTSSNDRSGRSRAVHATIRDESGATTALGASRTKTLGVTTLVTGTTVRIVRADTASFTMPIVNGGTNGGTLFTFASAPSEKQGATFYYNGVDWVLVGFEYLVS